MATAATVLVMCAWAGTATAALPVPDALPPNTVLRVSEVPEATGKVTVAELRHALAQAAAQAGREQVPAPGTPAYERLERSAVEALIEAIWLKGQGAEMGIVVTPGQIARELAQIKREIFESAAEYREFLRDARYTRRDVIERVELQLLSRRIQRRISAGIKDPAEEKKVFTEFLAEYNERWRSRTVCAPEYVTRRCSNGPPLDSN